MTLPVREAAKAILYTPNGEVLLAAGKRGMLNLPGGGLDGDLPGMALMRELDEELGIRAVDLVHPLEHVGMIEGGVTDGRGMGRTACWALFSGHLRDEALPAPRAEITGLDSLLPEVAARLGYPVMSDLAARAIREFGLIAARR